MSNEHVPVLLDDVLQMAQGMSRAPKLYLDGTFGRGGHAREIMKLFPEVHVIAFDRDEDALAFGRENFASDIESGRLQLMHANFVEFEKVYNEQLKSPLAEQRFDLMLLDLGVSSPQLDQGERGFSFYSEGPLDMRMDRSQKLMARDIVNEWSKEQMIELFQEQGEVRRPFRVIDAIIERRQEQPFDKTRELSALIEKVEGWRKKGHHPATRYFMALRLYVNSELEQIEKAIPQLINGLSEGGRLMVITFHSLEDRIVKYAFKESSVGFPVNKKVIQAHWNEKKKNPRARSAKLRVFEKGGNNES